MPLVTFFSVLELPEKNRKEQPPPPVRRGLIKKVCILTNNIIQEPRGLLKFMQFLSFSDNLLWS